MKKSNTRTLIALFSLVIGLICTYFLSPEAQTQNDMQKDIADKIIRFHVRANSDSNEDQQLKLMVKDRVVSYLSSEMNASTSKDDSMSYIENNLDAIKAVALEVITEQGYNYTVNAYITKEFFPTKSYGDVTIPCGEYDAFRIDIGDNSGKNWWCILYPPLCFVEGTYGIATDESKMLLKNVLDEDEFDFISNTSSDNIGFDFKFLSLFE